jgi:hypothetical protein
MPIVAAWRAALQQPAAPALLPQVDANADGRSDVFWHNPAAQRIQPWLMNGTSFAYGTSSVISSAYRVAAVGDFNGDGRADLVWRDLNRTVLWQWQARASGGYNIVKLRNYPTGWEIGGVGDINRDGRSDIIWHNAAQQRFQAWLMNGTTWAYGSVQSRAGGFVMVGAGDFNGDGYVDLLWRDSARTMVSAQMGAASGIFGAAANVRTYPAGWNPVGLRRANADARADIFWHNPTTGSLQAWLMNGFTATNGPVQAPGVGYSVSSMGDYNGDGLSDLLWHNDARTHLYLWLARTDGNYNKLLLRSHPAGWSIVH